MRLGQTPLRIAARKSDLARLQARSVGEALRRVYPQIQIEYQFRESLGDRNQSDPLWQMPEKGVFTQDFHEDLVSGRTDLVVHSWKDLPVQDNGVTAVVASLPRADARDLVLFKKSHRSIWTETRQLRVLSSSPRREHNLEPFFRTFLPFAPKRVEFRAVRGNVQTRVRKLLEDETADALVVAKAAIDRLLATRPEADGTDEFRETREYLRDAIKQCEFLVAPQSRNPTAAAQGALGIEIVRKRADLVDLLSAINDPSTVAAAEEERRILKKYGGGCHQKIGISVQTRDYGRIFSVRGLTDTGEKLEGYRLERERTGKKAHPERVFPRAREASAFFDRVLRPIEPEQLKDRLILVARENALPRGISTKEHPILWTAGLQTWKALADAGYWVSGTLDGLGEAELPDLSGLVNFPWLKLSHAEVDPATTSAASPKGGAAYSEMETLATYDLIPRGVQKAPDFGPATHFYWMSASSFEEAVATKPELLTLRHFCGPGNTYRILRQKYGPSLSLEIELSYPDFINAWVAIPKPPAPVKKPRKSPVRGAGAG